MRRRTAHAAFALASLAAAGVLAWELVALERAETINRALASVSGTRTGGAEGSGSDASVALPPDAAPRVQLARASAAAVRGDVETAERVFASLAREHAGTPLAEAARFALANRYLREGRRGELDPRRAAPLLELAKQRYRDILAERPDDWDVRYNLERALRLAPESAGATREDADDPVKSVDVVVPGFETKDLP